MNPKAKPTASRTASGSALFRSGKSKAETGSSWPARDTNWPESPETRSGFIRPARQNLPEELKLVILGTCLLGFVESASAQEKAAAPVGSWRGSVVTFDLGSDGKFSYKD